MRWGRANVQTLIWFGGKLCYKASGLEMRARRAELHFIEDPRVLLVVFVLIRAVGWGGLDVGRSGEVANSA